MATINEMRQVATQIENETQVGGNTASRVGGLFNDVVDKLEDVETDINIVKRVEITYKQCQIPNKYINDTNVGSALSLQSNNDYGVFYFFVRKGQSFAISSTYVAPSASRLYIFHLDEDLDIVQRYENVVVGTTTYTATEDCIVVGTLYGNDSIQYTGIQKAYLVNGKMNEVGLTGANIIQHLKDLGADIDNDITNLNTEVGALEDEVFGTPSVSNLPLPNDGVLNANGTISLYEDWYNSDYFAVDSAKQYTYNGSIYGGGNILYYDSAKNLLGACSNIPVNYADRTNPVELNDIPSNAAYIRVSGYDISACSITESDSLRPKVENIEERIDNLIKPQGIIEPVFGATLANPVRIKLLGDSITQGWGGSNFDQDGAEIYPLGEGWQTHRNLHGYCWANMMRDYLETKYHCTVVNNAITGTSTRNIVTRLDDFIDAADDIIICAYGTNNRNNYDGNNTEWNSFVPDLLTIVNYCKERNKTIILVANIPASSANEQSTDNGHAKSAHMNDVHDAVLYVAESTGVECVDMYDAFNDYCINTNTSLGVLLGDGLHPNDNGYDVYYSLIMPRIGVAIESAAESGGVIEAGNIKYDNSQSGLAADDVQGALDEVAKNLSFKQIPYDAHQNWFLMMTSGKWNKTDTINNYYRTLRLLQINGEKYIKVTSNDTYSAGIGFLKTFNPVNNQLADYCDGYTSVVRVAIGETKVFSIPNDCNYIVINCVFQDPSINWNYEPIYVGLSVDAQEVYDEVETIDRDGLASGSLILDSIDYGYYYSNASGSKTSFQTANIDKYKIKGIVSRIHLTARIGTAMYSLFKDIEGNILGSFAGAGGQGMNFNQDITLPLHTASIEISHSTTYPVYVYVLDRMVDAVIDLAAPVNGLLQLTSTNEGHYISSPTGTISELASFNIDYYNIVGSVNSIHIKARIGQTAYILLYDSSNNIIGYVRGNDSSIVGINFDEYINIPSNCASIAVSYSTTIPHTIEVKKSLPEQIKEQETEVDYLKNKLVDFRGKKIGLLGDSIAANGGFITKACQLLGATFKNAAIGGWFLGNKESKAIYKQINKVSPATTQLDGDEDLIVIFAGTNDFGHSFTIGEPYITDADGHRSYNTDANTTCGGLALAIQTLYTKYDGYIPIVICTPLQRSLAGASSSGGSWDKNSINKYMDDYIDAIISVATYYGIPVCDFYHCNMNPNIPAANTLYFADGLHPNAAGHSVMGQLLANFLVNNAFTLS